MELSDHFHFQDGKDLAMSLDGPRTGNIWIQGQTFTEPGTKENEPQFACKPTYVTRQSHKVK
jgi:hypothetical protein